MTDDARAWLSPHTYEQVRHELDRLLLSHRAGIGACDGADADAWARHQWRDRRIRQLQELLLTARIAGAPPDDGIAEAGMILTVRFDGAAETDTVLLADGDPTAATDVYSCSSPIGRALLGARAGDTRTCLLPDGHELSITVLAAKPYHQCTPPTSDLEAGPQTDRGRHDRAG